MEPHALARCHERIEARRKAAGDGTREHVAGARGREPGRGARCAGQLSLRPGDHRVRPLGDDHHAARAGQRHGAFDAGGAFLARKRAFERDQFALVRGGDERRAAFGEKAGAQQHQRIGVEDNRYRIGQRDGQSFPRRAVATKARADEDRGVAVVGEKVRDRSGFDDKVARAVALVGGEELDVARPCPLRGGAGKDRGARHRAAHDRKQPARVLVRVGRGSRNLGPRDGLRGAVNRRHTDGHKAQVPHARACGHQEMRELPGAKRQRQGVGGQVLVQEEPGIGRNAAGHIDRDRLGMARGKIGYKLAVRVLQRARKAASEKAVDEDLTARKVPLTILHLALVERAGGLRRLGHGSHRRDDHDLAAAPPQAFGDDIAIAAVVARPAQHAHRIAARDAPDPGRRALPGPLHQFIDRNAVSDQRLFGGAHLRNGQDLVGGGVSINVGHGSSSLPERDSGRSPASLPYGPRPAARRWRRPRRWGQARIHRSGRRTGENPHRGGAPRG